MAGLSSMLTKNWGQNSSKIFMVDNKPLKPSNIWQNLVGLGLVAFVWKARQWRK